MNRRWDRQCLAISEFLITHRHLIHKAMDVCQVNSMSFRFYTLADFDDSSSVKCETSIPYLLFYKLYESPVVMNPIGKTSSISLTPLETTLFTEKSSKRHHAFHSYLPTSHSSNVVNRKVYRRYLYFWDIGREIWRKPRVFRSRRIR